mmetsp:Transcript_104791/g.146071  ORF Transcript_104791/g.146071 Transcript_104791/m.146071 type:complete len:81 (-) Transcript_104791:122-364(-)
MGVHDMTFRQAFAKFGGAVFGTAAVLAVVQRAAARGATRTNNPEWRQASQEYMKYQNMNPIFGVRYGRGYEPPYMQNASN